MNKHADIIAKLELANNGYTFQRYLSHEDFVAAEAAVKDGVACKRRDFERFAGMARIHPDNPAIYFLPKHAAILGFAA